MAIGPRTMESAKNLSWETVDSTDFNLKVFGEEVLNAQAPDRLDSVFWVDSIDEAIEQATLYDARMFGEKAKFHYDWIVVGQDPHGEIFFIAERGD